MTVPDPGWDSSLTTTPPNPQTHAMVTPSRPPSKRHKRRLSAICHDYEIYPHLTDKTTAVYPAIQSTSPVFRPRQFAAHPVRGWGVSAIGGMMVRS